MASAPDIITYIGVPLAVLGVLPIIYTVICSLLTLRSIQKTLSANGVTAITRSSLLSGDIEIEIPRHRILPDKSDDGTSSGAHLNEHPSSLNGGTWTIFRWQAMVIGSRTYRLRYHDELRQPQAEIELEPLVAYLLELGAAPTKQGFSSLKKAGLWTPAGTTLLVWRDTGDAVLRVSTPEDSDGVLSLAMQWRPTWKNEGLQHLPPYSLRLRPRRDQSSSTQALISDGDPGEKRASDEATDVEKASPHRYAPTKPALRLRLDSKGLSTANEETQTTSALDVSHLAPSILDHNIRSTWFASAATALNSTQSTTPLWAYSIPRSTLEICCTPIVPAGVLVMAGIVPEDRVPRWRSAAPQIEAIENARKHERMRKQGEAMLAEGRLPSSERLKAMRDRMMSQAMQCQDDARRKAAEEEQQRAQDGLDALKSEKLTSKRLGELAMDWLKAKGGFGCETSIEDVVESVLYQMVMEAGFAGAMITMLERFAAWTRFQGPSPEDVDLIKTEAEHFAVAACLIWFIASAAQAADESVTSDMQECLQLWKKVRLG